MLIMFEPLIRKDNLVYQLPPESWIQLAKIKIYIEESLMPLKAEIDHEEANGSDENPCGIVVHFPKGIEFRGYKHQLLNKMKDCFEKAERDVQLLWFGFDDKVRDLLSESF
jgi:hypothetical protein